MDLIGEEPVLNIFDKNFRIYFKNTARPPQFIGEKANVINSIVSEGCYINGTVENSILSGGVVVEVGATVKDSVIMSDVVIKKNASVYSAIIDSDSVIDNGATVGIKDAGKDDITVVAKNTTVKKVNGEDK